MMVDSSRVGSLSRAGACTGCVQWSSLLLSLSLSLALFLSLSPLLSTLSVSDTHCFLEDGKSCQFLAVEFVCCSRQKLWRERGIRVSSCQVPLNGCREGSPAAAPPRDPGWRCRERRGRRLGYGGTPEEAAPWLTSWLAAQLLIQQVGGAEEVIYETRPPQSRRLRR